MTASAPFLGRRLLAPMRGVTIRAFRRAFSGPIREAGFTAAVAPFIPANPGFRANDRAFAELAPDGGACEVIPQAIGKDPDALRAFLRALKDRGFSRCDLNAGCPFPMIVRRGRGAGLLANPDLLERLVETGCGEMGEGRFSLKVRLGLKRPDELEALLPRLNRHPLAFVVVHARTAAQMYAGDVASAAWPRLAAASRAPVVCNGECAVTAEPAAGCAGVMVGRAFVRALGARADARDLLAGYCAESRRELSGDAPVLGRMKELLGYWKDSSEFWRRRWPVAKTSRSLAEFALATGIGKAAI